MKERPIFMSARMVRVILEGRKTQTRRAVKWKYGPNGTPLTPIEQVDQFADIVQGLADNPSGSPVPFCESKCPYGVPGDRLWVREGIHLDEDKGWCYDADGEVLTWRKQDEDAGIVWLETRPAKKNSYPSMYMPRWASRITLEVTGVRAERLCDISDADVRAEGWTRQPYGDKFQWYRDLWESLHGAGSWAANPWVWVIEFKRLDGAAC